MAQDDQQNYPPSEEGASRRGKLPTTVITALITAAATVIAALVPVITGYVQVGKQSVAATPTVTVTVPQNSPPRTVASSGPSSPPAAARTYLTDLEPVQDSNDISSPDWTNDSVTIEGRTYDHSMETPRGGDVDCEGLREYALSRRYSRLRAVVGLDDKTSETTPAVFKVITDGKSHSYNVQLRKPITLNLDVRGVVRLGLKVEFPQCDTVAVAVGDPQLE